MSLLCMCVCACVRVCACVCGISVIMLLRCAASISPSPLPSLSLSFLLQFFLLFLFPNYNVRILKNLSVFFLPPPPSTFSLPVITMTVSNTPRSANVGQPPVIQSETPPKAVLEPKEMPTEVTGNAYATAAARVPPPVTGAAMTEATIEVKVPDKTKRSPPRQEDSKEMVLVQVSNLPRTIEITKDGFVIISKAKGIPVEYVDVSTSTLTSGSSKSAPPPPPPSPQERIQMSLAQDQVAKEDFRKEKEKTKEKRVEDEVILEEAFKLNAHLNRKKSADAVAVAALKVREAKKQQKEQENLLKDEAPSFQLFVVDVDGRTKTVTVKPTTKTSDLKKSIRKITGVNVKEQRLIFAGKQLQDRKPLAFYHLGKESTVRLVLRVRGGGQPKGPPRKEDSKVSKQLTHSLPPLPSLFLSPLSLFTPSHMHLVLYPSSGCTPFQGCCFLCVHGPISALAYFLHDYVDSFWCVPHTQKKKKKKKKKSWKTSKKKFFNY